MGCAPFRAFPAPALFCRGPHWVTLPRLKSNRNSSYNALWVTLPSAYLADSMCTCPTPGRSQLITTRSAHRTVIIGQDSYDLSGDRGLSDFDARHRLVVNAIYDLPFRGNRLIEGWRLATIVQAQSGNPVNIITSNSTVNGVANTLRPDVAGPVRLLAGSNVGSIPAPLPPCRAWASGAQRGYRPGLSITRISLSSRTPSRRETSQLQFRAEFFDLFNHANLANPEGSSGVRRSGRLTTPGFRREIPGRHVRCSLH